MRRAVSWTGQPADMLGRLPRQPAAKAAALHVADITFVSPMRRPNDRDAINPHVLLRRRVSAGRLSGALSLSIQSGSFEVRSCPPIGRSQAALLKHVADTRLAKAWAGLRRFRVSPPEAFLPVLGRLRPDSRALWRAVSAVGRWRHLAEQVRASTRVAGRSCPDGWGLPTARDWSFEPC